MPSKFKHIVVTGSREGHSLVEEVLTEFYTPSLKLYVGDAAGVDTQAIQWAVENRINLQTFHADWNSFGRAAGPKRNQKMIDTAIKDTKDPSQILCLAFPLKTSKGTFDCYRRAKDSGLYTRVFFQ